MQHQMLKDVVEVKKRDIRRIHHLKQKRYKS